MQPLKIVRDVAKTGKISAVSSQAVYPASLYPDPRDLPDLGDAGERHRLSPAAVRAFLNIAKHWELRDEDARRLLDDLDQPTWSNWKRGLIEPMTQERLMRISYMIGIFKSLNILFSESLADRWISLPNSNQIFTARTPLEYMLRGGSAAMDMVRRLLDARRGG